jgi:crotonobetainyl-CoA:carnitine CoA-transferase CaiB-like acyl-CoA transferase
MPQAFENIRILDLTHVVAGPFSTYQLAVMGADVIKIEHPVDYDQSRDTGSDRELNAKAMGLHYMAQASNKRGLALDIKTEEGREILRRLVKTADVLVENYRPGSLDALGLGYEAVSKINPRLIYCSISAFGQMGPRSTHTAYDHVAQAAAGFMSMTGMAETLPVKIGPPVVDYATGMSAAFAISSALFQRERSGQGQRIDVAMADVALMFTGMYASDYLRTGDEPHAMKFIYATNLGYDTSDGLLICGASNLRQQRRLWLALDRPDMAKNSNAERRRDHENEIKVLAEILKSRTAEAWENFFQERHVPAARVRSLAEALHDPHFKARGVMHGQEGAQGVPGRFEVPMAAFRFQHDGPAINAPPPAVGQHSEGILAELGYSEGEIKALRGKRVI